MKIISLTRMAGLAAAITLGACNGTTEDKDTEDTDETEETDDTTVDTDDTTMDTDDTTMDTDDTDVAMETLYDQLGGEAGVSAVLDGFLANVLANTEINWFFANADAARLKTQLADQICEAAGGGCTYSGQTMLAAHAGMAITDAQFNSMVGDLLTALDTLSIDYTAGTFDGGLPADALVTVLAGMQGDIVEDAAGDTVYFNQLGGYASVTAVVDTFVTNVAADSRINAQFAATDIPTFKAYLVDQICEATGGYCVYSGQTMLAAHAGLCISDNDWNALIEDLLSSLDTYSVAYTPGTFDGGLLGDPLVTVLAGMYADIVEDPEDDGCL